MSELSQADIMTENEQAAHTFAEQFTPPLRVVKTERVNNIPIPDAWTVAYWDESRKLGITAIAHSGQMHAYLEFAGMGSSADYAGRCIAKALGLFQVKPNAKLEAYLAQHPDSTAELFQDFAFDGLDALPAEHASLRDNPVFLWLYRAACLRMIELGGECGKGLHCAMPTGDAIENAEGERVCSYCKKPVHPEGDR